MGKCPETQTAEARLTSLCFPSLLGLGSSSLIDWFKRFLFIYSWETQREAETQAEGEAGSMHREPDVGFDPGSPGSRPGPKAGTKPLCDPGIPLTFSWGWGYISSTIHPLNKYTLMIRTNTSFSEVARWCLQKSLIKAILFLFPLIKVLLFFCLWLNLT